MTKIGVFTITIINLFWHVFQSSVSSVSKLLPQRLPSTRSLCELRFGEELRRPLAQNIYCARSRVEKLICDPTLRFSRCIFTSFTISLNEEAKINIFVHWSFRILFMSQKKLPQVFKCNTKTRWSVVCQRWRLLYLGMFTYDCQIEIRDFAFVCFLDLFELQALDTAKSRGSLNTATKTLCASGCHLLQLRTSKRTRWSACSGPRRRLGVPVWDLSNICAGAGHDVARSLCQVVASHPRLSLPNSFPPYETQLPCNSRGQPYEQTMQLHEVSNATIETQLRGT